MHSLKHVKTMEDHALGSDQLKPRTMNDTVVAQIIHILIIKNINDRKTSDARSQYRCGRVGRGIQLQHRCHELLILKIDQVERLMVELP